MLAETQALEKIVAQAQQLSPEYRLRLIQRITDTLILSFPRPSKPLQFGKYKKWAIVATVASPQSRDFKR